MAKKEETKIVLEREYNVPLRRKYLLVQRYRRTNKAVKTLKEFIAKHMKSENVKLGRYLNTHLWKHGIKNPPHHVSVIAKKDDKGMVSVEMKGAPVEKAKEEKKAKPATKAEEMKDKLKQVVGVKTDKPAEKKEEKTPEPKKEVGKEEKKVEPAKTGTKPEPAKPAAAKPVSAPKTAEKTEVKKPASKTE